MGKKTPKHGPTTPRASPRVAPRVVDAGNDSSAVRRLSGVNHNNGDETSVCTTRRCSAGMTEPVDTVLRRLSKMREDAQRKKHDEDSDDGRVAEDRLQGVRDVARTIGANLTRDGRRSNTSSAGKSRYSRGSSSSSGNAPVGTTLRKALGLPAAAPSLRDSCALILIDCQVTYTEGPMRLHRVEEALAECQKLLRAARRAGALVVHVAHHAGTGTLYDVEGRSGAIVEDVAPIEGEKTIVKSVPSSFVGTDLEEYLDDHGVQNLVLCGFMTHCCVSSTARNAFNLQKFKNVTVVASATATRSLPDPASGEGVDPVAMQESTLAGISELHANVVPSARDVPQ